jgi:hypothetical protein
VDNVKNGNMYKFVYDGNAHAIYSSSVFSYTSATIKAMNRSISFANTATITDVGEMAATFSVKITDENGSDVTDEYWILAEYATLKVTPRKLEITVKDAKKVYDGTPLVAQGFTHNNALVSGHMITEVIFSGSQTEIGSTEAIVDKVTIVDGSGNDVTHNYAISYIPGELKVTR